MPANQLLYLCRADVEAVGLTVAEIIKALEIAFREKGEGRVEMPPKPGIHPSSEDNFIHAMLAYIPALKSAGVKWVSGFPENYKRDLPYISGLLILSDVETGLPLAVMDCSWITAVRTGAATALAARYLARSESSIVGVLGCGVQGHTNVEALRVLFPLERVIGYDVKDEVAHCFADEIRGRFGLEVVVANTPREAVTGCDLIVTAGPILKKPHRTIQAGWMDEGAFASLVDFDSYWHPDAMKEVDKFCTDDLEQLHYYEHAGYFQDIPPVHADLGELVAGKKTGRQTPTERTMAANLGIALDDMAVASLLYQQAVDREIGTWLPL